jgi:DNA polymerase-3 subunit delta'
VDIERDLQAIASHVSFDWLRKAVTRLDELLEFTRRNIQKNIALDALVVQLRDI